MSYAVGLRLDSGLVFMSDTRTNAGVDNVSMYRKMFTWAKDGERVMTLLTAGNLATTQAVVSLIDERSKATGDRNPTILQAPSMFQAARIIGSTLREIIQANGTTGKAAKSSFNATLILGGQIAPDPPRLFMIYPQGNFVEASDETPFFQIGETKYGRPILIRAYDPAMSFEEAVKLLMVSFDSTLKANLSVGMPLDLQVYETDSFVVGAERRIDRDDAYFQIVHRGWRESLKQAFANLPPFEF